jgi:hypothetical protein
MQRPGSGRRALTVQFVLVLAAVSLTASLLVRGSEATHRGASASVDAVRVVAQQTGLDPPRFLLLVANLSTAPVVALSVGGKGDDRATDVYSLSMNVPTRVGSPPGWQGRHQFGDESDLMSYIWRAADGQDGLKAGDASCDFSVTLPGPPGNATIKGGQYVGVHQVNFDGVSFFAGTRFGYFEGKVVGDVLRDPAAKVLVTTQQIHEAPHEYLLVVTNLADSPLRSLVVGRDPQQMAPAPTGGRATIGAPAGWAASSGGAGADVAASWTVSDDASTIKPAQSACGFRLGTSVPLPSTRFVARFASGRQYAGVVGPAGPPK